MRYVLGIDIGGTFTDACAIGDDATIVATKTASTPPDYGRGVLGAVAELAKLLGMDDRELLANTRYICHGTTSTLNALVVGDVAKVGFLTTRGHKDSISLMNIEGRYAGLDPESVQDMLRTSKPPALVPPAQIRELNERTDYKGSSVVTLDDAEIRTAVAELTDDGAEAIAVSLLWSFLNPRNEQRVREIVAEIDPEMYVALSSDISPRIGEYGRSTTTIMSTQVGPRLHNYLSSLEADLAARGFAGKLLVMQGSGGAISAAEAAKHAIVTVGSVLTGGVVGAVTLGNQLGHKNIIATDMGGTTFLVGLVLDGKPLTSGRAVIGQHSVNLPMVQIHTIGSGGGAIAWIDGGGNLRVGPRSAQAKPGPACYGAGGVEPTITDADLVLGIIDPDAFLGGRMKLDAALARSAIKERVADPLGLSVEDAAAAIFAVANAQIADAVRQVVVNNGYDPRDFVLYSYGGAGPVHCAKYASDLGLGEVVIPLGPTASAFSAFGLAASDVVITVERSLPANYPVPAVDVNTAFEELEREATQRISDQKLELTGIEYRREIDIRYSLQMAEVATQVKPGLLEEADIAEIAGNFENEYQRIYGKGTGFSAAGFQFITYRVQATGRLSAQFTLPEIAEATEASPVPRGSRPVHLDPVLGWQQTAVYDYLSLRSGHVIEGPALIEAPATTVVVPADSSGRVDRLGNLVIEPK